MRNFGLLWRNLVAELFLLLGEIRGQCHFAVIVRAWIGIVSKSEQGCFLSQFSSDYSHWNKTPYSLSKLCRKLYFYFWLENCTWTSNRQAISINEQSLFRATRVVGQKSVIGVFLHANWSITGRQQGTTRRLQFKFNNYCQHLFHLHKKDVFITSYL